MLDTPVPTLELVAVRMGMTWICCQIYMASYGIANPILGPKEVRGWLATRGVVGFFGIFGLYYSLQYMSLSDATVLTFLAPSITALLGYLLLHESISRGQVVAGLTSLLGVVLIARPASLFSYQHTDKNGAASDVTESQRMAAVCVGLAGVFATSIAYTSIRVIGKRAHPMHSISYYSIWCVLMGTLGMSVTGSHWVLPTQWTWLATLLFIGLIFLTIGLQRETASRGTLAIYTQIVFTVGFEYFGFGMVPPVLSILGAVVIIVSAIYVALNKPGNDAPPEADLEEAQGLLAEQNDTASPEFGRRESPGEVSTLSDMR
ncbi:hypothetical protein FRC07_008519 [Ceratobasidium sp. 392]|nr:hypothetical protein FRC07_008519 [Ceratobasidium sp. 392]